MRIIVLLILTFIGSVCFGQDTSFFDAQLKPATRANAEFFRIEKKVGNLWERRDYYLKANQIQKKGTYSSLNPDVEDGHFEWFYSNGKLRRKGNYKGGKEVGEHLWYGPTDSLEARETYKNGKLNGPYEEYYPSGKLKVKTSFVNGRQDGPSAYYRDDGSKQSEGLFKAGNKNGEWKYFDATGKLEGTKTYKIEYKITEAKMFLRLPNDEWSLGDHSGKDFVQYIFQRTAIEDSLGRKISPAIMVYVEDATMFNQDVVLFSVNKQGPFKKKGMDIGKSLTQYDKGYPLTYKNALFMKATYTEQGLNHILYMIHIITKENKGIQVYLDMTKDLAPKYEKEFWTTIKSLKEIK